MQTESLVESFRSATLTADQTDAVRMLADFLKNKQKNVFLLRGYAGTGKTFLMKGLVKFLEAAGRSFILAASTGKAAVTLSHMTKVPASTIHSLIYDLKDLREYKQEIEGSQTYKFYTIIKHNTYTANTIYIVDEASMIPDVYQEGEFFRYGSGFLLRDFFKFISLDNNDHNKKIIFIGDDAQLPPVGMSFSPALNIDYLTEKYSLNSETKLLTDVVRQKQDSGILINASNIRKSIDSNIFNRIDINFSLSDVQKVEYESLSMLYSGISKKIASNDIVLIARTNADACAYNKEIRKLIFPGCTPRLRAGDKIICSCNTRNNGEYISNGSMGLLKRIIGDTETHCVKLRKKLSNGEVEEKNINLNFIKAELEFKGNNDTMITIEPYIFENHVYHSQSDMAIEEQKGLYIDFCQRNPGLKAGTKPFLDALLSDPYFNSMRINYGYAITCHKAQGSAWKHVFVLCRGARSDLNRDYFRWLYTAMTRASEKLYMIEPPNFTLLGGMKSIDFTPCSTSVQKGQQKTSVDPSDISGQLLEASCFGIKQEDSTLFYIYNNVHKLLSDKPIRIDHIDHNQYQEAYFFSDDNEVVRINIYYDADGKIKKLLPAKSNMLSNAVLEILNPLLLLERACNVNKVPEFAESFLEEFHAELCDLLSRHGIEFASLEALQWCQRYTFRKNSKMVKIDFWYNSKKQFKKHHKAPSFNSDVSLLQEINTILNEQI